jgi:glucose-6-phosphate isomerase
VSAPDDELATTSRGGLNCEFGYPDTDGYPTAVDQLVVDEVASRITAQDPTLWGPDAESEAAIRLSWATLGHTSVPLVEPILALRDELRAEGLDHVVLAGMGGSSLAPEVICQTAGVELVTLDTTDPGQVSAAIADRLDRTVLVVSSKSGGTVETDSHRRAYEQAFTEAGLDPKQRIVVVTDPGSPLQQVAEDAGYRKVFLADPYVGGRYSALTAFGLVPAGLAGADIQRLLDDAAAAATALAVDERDNPGLRLGALLGLAHNAGSDKVVFADFGSGISGFGDWAEQLIAESTGKDGRGLLPVVVEEPGAPGFTGAGRDAILVHLVPASGGYQPAYPPASGWAAATAGPLGGQLLLWEYATAVAGRLIGINPFDQPNVEEAKKQARSLLDSTDSSAAPEPVLTEDAIQVFGYGIDLSGVGSVDEALQALFAGAPAFGYVSIQAYLDRLADTKLAELRPAVASRTGLQTTFGWGPRFLRSRAGRTASAPCSGPRRPATRPCWRTRAVRCCTCISPTGLPVSNSCCATARRVR